MTNETQTAAPKAAKKARKAKTPKTSAFRRCKAAEFRHYAKYAKTVTVNGNASADNNDSVSQKLRGSELDDVYSAASKALKVPVTQLKARYAKLNVGMQRMNLGNRIRGAQAAAEAAKG